AADMLTVTGVGVLQQSTLDGETTSQLPPDDVLGVAVKPNSAPVLAMVTICGSGFAPAKGIVKERAGIVWNAWAWSVPDRQNISARASIESAGTESESMVPR